MRSGTVYRSALFHRLGVRASGERVLDIGSFDSYWLSQQPGVMRVGVDLDIRRNEGCHVLRGTALRLPFADATFDSVFAFEVIEHVDDDRQFLGELARVVRPGGTITISTPAADLRIFPARLTPWAHRRWGHYHRTGYERAQLDALLRDAGAPQVEVRQLSTWTMRHLYLPLTLLGRVSEALAAAAFRACAAIDARLLREGPHGYLLATAKR